NTERDRLIGLAGELELSPDLDGPARRRLVYQLGPTRFRDRALIAWAEAVAGGAAMDRRLTEAWTDLLRAAADWVVPRFPLKGRDAVKLGVPPGPAVGRLMAMLEDWWIAGDFQADREACVAKLKELSATATSPPAAGS